MSTRTFREVAPPAVVAGQFWVYILQTADGALYVGQSNNVLERLRKHRLGIGSKFTCDHGGPILVYVEGPLDLAAAVSREHQLKRWSRAKKEALVLGDREQLRALARSND